MNFNENLCDVSFESLNKMHSELKARLFKQEEDYLRELNAYKAFKCLLELYENEIARRVKEAEEFI